MSQNKRNFIDSIHTIIAEGSVFDGNFSVNSSIRIDGYLKGVLKSEKKVYIGTNGIVDASIIAKEIIIAGKVKGFLKATKFIQLLSSAHVYGDVCTPHFIVEPGSLFDGRTLVYSHLLE